MKARKKIPGEGKAGRPPAGPAAEGPGGPADHDAAEVNFKLLFDKMLNGACFHEIMCDASGRPNDYRFLAVNPAFERMTGLKADAVVGRTAREVMPEIGEDWIALCGRVALSGGSERAEGYSGRLGRHFRAVVYQTRPGRFAVLFSDLTEEKRAHGLLASTKAQQRAILDNIPYLAWLKDREGRFLEVNAHFAASCGRPAGEIIGRTDLDIWPRVLAEKYRADDAVVMRGGGGILVEEPIADAGGTRWFETFKTPVRGEGGAVIGTTGLSRDITERRRTEDALRESEARFRNLFEHAVIGMYRTTPDGRILMANPALILMLGFDGLEDLQTRDLGREGHAEPGRRGDFMREMEQRGMVVGWETEWLKKNGRSLFVRESAVAVKDTRGGILYYEGTVEDISKLRVVEEQFLQAQKMEAMGRLAGGVAHDFNNLLMATLSYGDLALRSLPPDHPARRPILGVKETVERGAGLTRQLLAFSRKQTLRPRVFDLNGLIADTVKMLRHLIGEDIRVTTQLHPSGAMIKADPPQIEQALMNLAVNARDAMPGGGELILRTGWTEGDHGDAGGRILLEVADTGCGMDAATRARVFEPFFTTKPEGKGTGLGLATVFGIVRQSEGTIEVESEAGRGTVFRIWLPESAEAAESRTEAVPVTGPSAGTETVLLVEDDDAVRDVLRTHLEMSGYAVLAASDGAEALETAARCGRPIHVLVSDLVMPSISGATLAVELRRRHPGLPAILMSGYPGDHTGQAVPPDGTPHFLQKPFPPDALLAKIREVLKRAS